MNHPNCGDLENQCWEGVLITLQQIGPVWASSLLTPMSPFGQLDHTFVTCHAVSLNGDI